MLAGIELAQSAQNSFNLLQCDSIAQELEMDNNIKIGVLSFQIQFDSYGTLGKFLAEVEENEIEIANVRLDKKPVVITHNE